MEVRKGFKQTDVGIIPENWNIELLIQCCNYVDYRGKTPHKTASGTFLITARNVRKGFIDYEISKEYVPTEEYDFTMSRGKPQLGDVIITTEAPLGMVAQIDREDVALAQRIIKYRPKDFRLSSNYLKHYLLSDRFQSILNSRSSGSTATGIKGSVLHQLPVVIPPLAEQEAIAEALSDADALIESLETLLAKKRQVKQGAMSELLSGKKRLPEFGKKQGYKQTPFGVFPKDWEIVPLKEVSSMHGRIGWQGLKQTEFTMNSDEPFLITGMNFKDGEIRWEEVYHISEERYGIAKEIQLKIGDVLMTKDGTIGKILFVDHIPYPGKASLNSHLLVFRPINKRYVPKFMFYQLNYRTFHNHIELEKSGTTFFGITQEAVGKYNAFLPSIAEQTAIVEILSDMDAEIRAAEEKLSKARAVKAGMMSELLTGRVRLVK